MPRHLDSATLATAGHMRERVAWGLLLARALPLAVAISGVLAISGTLAVSEALAVSGTAEGVGADVAGSPGVAGASTASAAAQQAPDALHTNGIESVEGIRAVRGIRAGHYTYPGGRTGCTVVIALGGAVAGVDVRGGSPGTVETDLLDPVNAVQKVNAVVLAGGSAFGLAARQGVVRWLEERGEGHAIGPDTVVPIVPGAIIFDLRVSDGTRPGPECGYSAANAAGEDVEAGAANAAEAVVVDAAAAYENAGPLAEGNVGAGAGATVGKLLGPERAMRGGVGTAAIALADGLVVAVLVVVNAVGDVIDPATSEVVAGARGPDGRPADARAILRRSAPDVPPGQNTTIGVVATNALLTQAEATKVAQMAHDGLARVIVPAHMPGDGDAIFALATGELGGVSNVGRIGALAAEAVAEAVLRAVRAATGIPGVPAAADLPAK